MYCRSPLFDHCLVLHLCDNAKVWDTVEEPLAMKYCKGVVSIQEDSVMWCPHPHLSNRRGSLGKAQLMICKNLKLKYLINMFSIIF